ncbi:MAG: hypothetical protein K5796_09825 [Lachnospiraceae bacterium]|nr:hypothetical protein [Lachnospiraceae bacterium]
MGAAYSKLKIALAGLASGLYFFAAYLFPLEGKNAMSLFIMQMSGARGSFALHGDPEDILRLTAVFIPDMVFIVFLGKGLYGSFCTGSVYLMSRQVNRKTWFLKETLGMFVKALLFEGTTAVFAVIPIALLQRTVFDAEGLMAFLFHVYVSTALCFFMSVLFTVLAVYLGSNMAYSVSLALSGVFLVGLAVAKAEPLLGFPKAILLSNPMTHRILSWQNSSAVDRLIENDHPIIDTALSLTYLTVLMFVIEAVSMFVILKKDIIMNDTETGTI